MAFEIVEIGIINDILRTSCYILEIVIIYLMTAISTQLQCIGSVVLFRVGIHTAVMKGRST